MKKYNQIKRFFVFVIIATLLVNGIPFFSIAIETTAYDFPNFSEADSMAFVEECGITIPNSFLNYEELPTFTRKLILKSYNEPDVPFPYNAYDTQSYAEDIRLAVRAHMNLENLPATISTSIYTLQYNTVMDSEGNWVTSGGAYDIRWFNYNCYAYSIKRAETSPYYSTGRQYQPGDMSYNQGETRYVFKAGDSVNTVANVIRNDLIEMGYSNITFSSSIPTITSSQELICVRVGDEDYHFMRYDSETNAWYHKPGSYAVLKYNYVPSNDLIWYCETSYFGNETLWDNFYDSEIIFISYSKNLLTANSTVTSREYIQSNKDVFCEITSTATGMFKVELNSNYTFEYELYDEDFYIITYGQGTDVDEYLEMTGGTYYLRMNFCTNTSLDYIDVSVAPHTAHTFTYQPATTNNTHIVSCPCGYERTESCTGKMFKKELHCIKCNRIMLEALIMGIHGEGFLQ